MREKAAPHNMQCLEILPKRIRIRYPEIFHIRPHVACVAGVRKGEGRELGRETTREGHAPRALERPNFLFPF